ncbi:cell surface protein [bacterium DOLZORAL124_64_63]|nr:MAG: cell surface protein [bacterium DOLZORAL124_64_63]
MKNWTILLIIALLLPVTAFGQFADNGQVNNEYDRADPALSFWASEVVDSERGYQDYQQPELGYASVGTETDMLGPDGSYFCLGDHGHITVTFEQTIMNGPGDDLVVFENGFAYNGGVFMELGFVEVSSNGVDFSRLPALCRRDTQPGGFDVSDPALFYNLAGNFLGGTGFDLEDLIIAGDANVQSGLVDLNAISHVRVVDVVGDISGPGATFDFLGRPVADPYPTPFASSGMDITGVAGIHGGVVATQVRTLDSIKSLYR